VRVVSCAVEGSLDEVIARRLLSHVNLTCGPVYGREGKSHLRKRIGGYAEGARRTPWFILVDLNAESPCAGDLVQQWLPEPPPMMRLRVAVRESEAWLMADRNGLASFLSVSQDLIPRAVDEIDDPKSVLVAIARRSRRRVVREGLPPRSASGRSIGPLYVTELSSYVRDHWNVDEASLVSSSLAGCVRALTSLVSEEPGRQAR
jgi:hypothetical protein